MLHRAPGALPRAIETPVGPIPTLRRPQFARRQRPMSGRLRHPIGLPESTHVFITAILLAGGRAPGRRVPRPLRRSGGVTYLERAVEQALASCADEVVVVIGRRVAHARDVLEPRARLKVIVDPLHTEKRAALLATGIRGSSAEATAFFAAYGDDRAPAAKEIDQFLAASSRGHKPLVLRFDKKKRSLLPLLFDRTLKSELLSDVDDETLRRVVERDPSRLSLVPVEAKSSPPARGRRKHRP